MRVLMFSKHPMCEEATDATATEGGGGTPAETATRLAEEAADDGEAKSSADDGEAAGDPTAQDGAATLSTLAAMAAEDQKNAGEPTGDDGAQGSAGNEDAEVSAIENAILEGESEFKGKWDVAQIRGIAPMLKECGVSKENAARLAVKLAEIQRHQMQESLAQNKAAQLARIKAADEANAKVFSAADYKQIFAGIKAYTKEDSPLRQMLLTTELGTDQELLRILHALGAKNVSETAAPVATGAAGNSNGWAASFEK